MDGRVDLGPGQALRHERDCDRCVVLLPGQFYPTRAPALWFVREAAMASGWSAVIDGLARASRAALLAGGDADPTWRPDAVPADRPIDVVELPGVDHALQVPGDPVASLHALGRLTDAVTRFLARL